MNTNIQYVSNSLGKITSVIVPYEIWEAISSEVETKYFLDNPVMRKRLLDARKSNKTIPANEVYEKLGI